MSIVRYYDGISDVSEANPLGMFPRLDPTLYAIWMDDFFQIPEVTTYWTHTQSGGTLAATSTGGTGVITQTLGGSDNQYSHMFLTHVTFALTSGKKMFFEWKGHVDKGTGGTIGEQELFMGLSSAQTTTNFVAADGLSLAVNDAIGFWSPDGSTNINCVCRATDVESVQTGASTYADATNMVLSIYFDGTTAYFYKDDTVIATLTGYPTASLTAHLFIKAGEAFAGVLTSDYVFVAVER